MDCSFVAGEGEEEEELGILINDQHDGFMWLLNEEKANKGPKKTHIKRGWGGEREKERERQQQQQQQQQNYSNKSQRSNTKQNPSRIRKNIN
jgi:hypothetical protein